jgi:hypothetical protein
LHPPAAFKIVLMKSRGPNRNPEKWKETEIDPTEKLNSESFQEEKPKPGWCSVSYLVKPKTI